MLRSLRNRLILSHILPALIVIPLMGIALIYFLETRVFLPSLTRELQGDAQLLAQIAARQPEVWQNPEMARELMAQVGSEPEARLMLLSPEGRLLGSSIADSALTLGEEVDAPGLSQAQQGQVVAFSRYSRSLDAEVIDVLAPAINPQGELTGIVRMTYRYGSIAGEFLALRYVIAGVVLVGLLVGSLIGSTLAVSLSNPMRRVTAAVNDLAQGAGGGPLRLEGPDELRILAGSVNLLRERLESFEQARKRLLANLVHELGRPLGALRSAIQALQRGASDDPELRDELLQGMDQETAQLQHLLDDLAQLHEQVLGALELEQQPVEVTNWLRSLLPPWREAARAKHLEWDEHLEPDMPLVSADPARLGQVIGNLVSNAIRYTPSGGRITVSTGTRDHAVWIAVADTGPGIPEEEQAKIFTPFFRGRHNTRFPQGLGLGLSIAQDLVQAHGGRLELESTPGAGSRFTLWLPVQPANQKKGAFRPSLSGE